MTKGDVLIMAGGTGGHVFPGLALAAEMIKRGHQVQWLGTKNGIESRLVPAAGIPLHFIPVRGVRGKSLTTLLAAPANILKSIFEALSVIKRIKPSVVVGLGGFVSGPGGIAAKILGIPLVLHEQNAVAGTTNRLLARIATKVLTAFPNNLKGAQCIGNPVRESIEQLPSPEERLGNRNGCVRVLVVGGSRGALAINKLLPQVFRDIEIGCELEVWHQAGEGKDAETIEAYEYLNEKGNVAVKVTAFIDDMSEALAWADFVICRSGALTVSELAAAGLGSVLIPFPYAIDDHQTENANVLVAAGAAIVQQEKETSVDKMKDVLMAILPNRNVLVDMAVKARSVSMPSAAKVFADVCEGAARV